MCSNACDCDATTFTAEETESTPQNLNCVACGEKAVILLSKRHILCKPCFLTKSLHKFRATLGKSKLMKHGDNVLLAFSGGSSSSAMLHMIKQGLAEDTHKRLQFHTSLLYVNCSVIDEIIFGSKTDTTDGQDCEIIAKMLDSELPCFLSSVEQVYNGEESQLSVCLTSDVGAKDGVKNEQLRESFKTAVDSFKTLTDKETFLKVMMRRLLIRIARFHKFNKILTGESGTLSSANLLSIVSQGRGAQIHDEIGFADSRQNELILRPMKEFSSKEIALYNHHNSIGYSVQPCLSSSSKLNASIQRLTETFINDLQSNFSATVSTVWRTGDKITTNVSDDRTCMLCFSGLDAHVGRASAFEALKLAESFSRSDSRPNNLLQVGDWCYGCQQLLKRSSSFILPPDVTASWRECKDKS